MISTIQTQMESVTITCPKVELKKLKGIVKAMGWVIESKRDTQSERAESEWTEEQERDAFLCTSRFNAAQLFSKHIE